MFLLDTHSLLWALFDVSKLPQELVNTLCVADNLYTSVGSLWEIAIKQSLGKLDIEYDPLEIATFCDQKNIGVLPILPVHLALLKDLPPIHKDPFDRLFVAQAKYENFVIVTKDSNIAKYQVKTIW